MHNKQSLLEDIAAMGFQPDDRIMIHSSMKAMGPVEGGAETVLDAFIEYFGSEGLLMFPTHSWKEWNTPGLIFDPANEPSCVGILPELFRKRKDAIRSLHPTHSISAMGPSAASFISGEEETRSPAPRQGCWGRLYDVDAKILFLGATLKTNTFLHSAEEWYGIDDRLDPAPTLFQIKLETGDLIPCPQNRHHSSFGDVSQNYGKIESALFERQIAHQGKIGDADSICCQAKPMADFVGELLETNPGLFNNNLPLS